LLSLALGQAAGADDLALTPDRPAVSVETRVDGRNFIRLPGLQYTVRVESDCDITRKPARLSLNVADTRVVLDEAEIDGAIDIPVAIPSGQIGPIAVEGFCLTGDDESASGKETMLVPSVLSLQASLLCTGESGNKIVYASTTLDVRLECSVPEDAAVTEADGSIARQ
jgi:hypothetical protein